jgi:hypothetical protein
VYADSFFPVGNIEQSQLSYVVGIGITELGNNTVTYSEHAVNGVLSDSLSDYTFETISASLLVESQLVGGVAAPAGSLLSAFWFPSNTTGHDVYVHNSWLFANDLRELGLSPVIYRSLLYYSNDQSANQVGECLQLGALGAIPFNVEVKGRKLFDFTIPQPIKIEQQSVTLSAESVSGNYKYHITVVNESDHDENVAVAGIDRIILANKAVIIEGAVNYYHELPRSLSLKGREIGCFRSPEQRNLLAISRNDMPANWFWGGIQFDKMGVSDVGNYCVARIDSDIAVDWTGSVDFEGTVSVSAVSEYAVTPPETAHLELSVSRAGGVHSASVVTEVFISPQMLPYYQGSSDTFRNEGSKVVFVSDMRPDSSKIIELEFAFPEKLPVEYYEQVSTLSYSVNGSSIKTVNFDFRLINKQIVEVTPLVNWCAHRKYQVNIKNMGNAFITDNLLPIHTSEYMTIDVLDNLGQRVIVRYEFSKGEYVIKIPDSNILKFNTSNLSGILIGTQQLVIPKCLTTVDSKDIKKPIQGSHSTKSPTPTVQKVIEVSPQLTEESSVNGVKSNDAVAINAGNAGSYIVFGQLLLLFIAMSIAIGAIKYAQSYRNAVPRKR